MFSCRTSKGWSTCRAQTKTSRSKQPAPSRAAPSRTFGPQSVEHMCKHLTLSLHLNPAPAPCSQVLMSRNLLGAPAPQLALMVSVCPSAGHAWAALCSPGSPCKQRQCISEQCCAHTVTEAGKGWRIIRSNLLSTFFLPSKALGTCTVSPLQRQLRRCRRGAAERLLEAALQRTAEGW